MIITIDAAHVTNAVCTVQFVYGSFCSEVCMQCSVTAELATAYIQCELCSINSALCAVQFGQCSLSCAV